MIKSTQQQKDDRYSIGKNNEIIFWSFNVVEYTEGKGRSAVPDDESFALSELLPFSFFFRKSKISFIHLSIHISNPSFIHSSIHHPSIPPIADPSLRSKPISSHLSRRGRKRGKKRHPLLSLALNLPVICHWYHCIRPSSSPPHRRPFGNMKPRCWIQHRCMFRLAFCPGIHPKRCSKGCRWLVWWDRASIHPTHHTPVIRLDASNRSLIPNSILHPFHFCAYINLYIYA